MQILTIADDLTIGYIRYMEKIVYRIEVYDNGYACLYDMSQPVGRQIELIAPLEEVQRVLTHRIQKNSQLLHV